MVSKASISCLLVGAIIVVAHLLFVSLYSTILYFVSNNTGVKVVLPPFSSNMDGTLNSTSGDLLIWGILSNTSVSAILFNDRQQYMFYKQNNFQPMNSTASEFISKKHAVRFLKMSSENSKYHFCLNNNSNSTSSVHIRFVVTSKLFFILVLVVGTSTLVWTMLYIAILYQYCCNCWKNSRSKSSGIFGSPETRVSISFSDLSLTTRSGKRILQNVNGTIKPGTFTGVLGTSGGGKSSFLSVIANRVDYAVSEGRVRFNGNSLWSSRYFEQVGFVPQEDTMFREMTVYEALWFAATYRTNMSSTKKKEIVDHVLKLLELEKHKNKIIGDENVRGISGGQRKRVNVGMELVAMPPVILLDEPTSGLDSTTALSLCRTLKDLASSGFNVIAVLHQARPEIFDNLDDIMVFHEGRLIEHENIDVLRNRLQIKSRLENIGDIILDRVSDNSYVKSPPSFEPVEAVMKSKLSSKPTATFFTQVRACFQRSVIQLLRSKFMILGDITFTVIASFMLSVLNKSAKYQGPPPEIISKQCPSSLMELCSSPLSDPIAQQSALLVLLMSLISAMSSLRCFGPELVVFKRESYSGLNTLAYFIAKDICSMFNQMLLPFVFLSIYYPQIQPEKEFWFYYLVLFLITWVTYGFGYIISLLVDQKGSQLCAAVVIFIMYLFCGFSPTLRELSSMTFPLPYVSYLSFSRYFREIFYIYELQEFKPKYDISKSMTMFDYHSGDKYYLWPISILFGIIFRVIGIIILHSVAPQSIFNSIKNKVLDTPYLCYKKVLQKNNTSDDYELARQL
jgi:ABC-type multidrug transport system ATPase subunit